MGRLETIRIDEQMEAFIDAQVRDGNYGSVEEVVGAALRVLRHQAELEAIEAAIAEAEESGPPRPFDFDAFVEAKRARRAQ
ncbi:type II toxin-antitoxin system ParD family antitoxin [Rhizobium sp. OAE497]|uniref:type II toxin-antitoxin system ParD family antitoxin n=1 Tax=Rhizobium sp. OAE497 TaxID=2663796 RepID=UPI0018F2E607